MKFISINGSTCSGKSSVIKSVMAQRQHLFYLSYDFLKRSFAQYDRHTQYKDVHAVMLAVAEAVFKMDYDVIAESGLYKEWRETLFNLARARGYEVIEVVLEADYAVLEKRFDERAALAGDPRWPVFNVSKERFKELYGIFQENKSDSPIIFRSDEESVEEITKSILKLF